MEGVHVALEAVARADPEECQQQHDQRGDHAGRQRRGGPARAQLPARCPGVGRAQSSFRGTSTASWSQATSTASVSPSSTKRSGSADWPADSPGASEPGRPGASRHVDGAPEERARPDPDARGSKVSVHIRRGQQDDLPSCADVTPHRPRHGDAPGEDVPFDVAVPADGDGVRADLDAPLDAPLDHDIAVARDLARELDRGAYRGAQLRRRWGGAGFGRGLGFRRRLGLTRSLAFRRNLRFRSGLRFRRGRRFDGGLGFGRGLRFGGRRWGGRRVAPPGRLGVPPVFGRTAPPTEEPVELRQ